jgi:hypothetical protein
MKAMISVLAHELTHIASGQPDSLRPLFRAIGRRAAIRTGLRIQGQRAEELACDLIGVMAARQFISQTPSWEPLPRRLTRAFEHNCVDDDASDEDHLSPRNTIRALLALDVTIAGEVGRGHNGLGSHASGVLRRLSHRRRKQNCCSPLSTPAATESVRTPPASCVRSLSVAESTAVITAEARQRRAYPTLTSLATPS